MAVAQIPVIGDVVFLKSGSPPLTASDIHGSVDDTIVYVTWFDGAALKRDGFHIDELTFDNPFAIQMLPSIEIAA